MTTPTETNDTEKAAPAEPTMEVTVAHGRTLMSMENKGNVTKVHKPSTKVTMTESEAHRLAALGFVVLPGADADAPAEPAGTENAPRNKGRFSISPKDGPRVDR